VLLDRSDQQILEMTENVAWIKHRSFMRRAVSLNGFRLDQSPFRVGVAEPSVANNPERPFWRQELWRLFFGSIPAVSGMQTMMLLLLLLIDRPRDNRGFVYPLRNATIRWANAYFLGPRGFPLPFEFIELFDVSLKSRWMILSIFLVGPVTIKGAD